MFSLHHHFAQNKPHITLPFVESSPPPSVSSVLAGQSRDQSGCSNKVPVTVYSLANDYSLPGASQILVLVITETLIFYFYFV